MAVWKYLPYEFFEIDAVEAWLDEQVSQGLALKKHFGRFFCFDRSSPGMTRYRVNIVSKNDPQSNGERTDAYREMGWEYVMTLSSRLELYRALRPDAAEMNTDEEVLNEALRSYTNGQIILGFVAIAIVLCSYVFNFSAMWRGGICTFLLNSGIWAPIIMFADAAVILLTFFFMIQPAFAMRKRKILDRDYHTPAVFAHRRRRWRLITLVAVVILPGIMLLIGSDSEMRYISPDDCHPVLTLEEICPAAAECAREHNSCRIDSFVKKTVSYQLIGPTVRIPDSETQKHYAPTFYYTVDTSTVRWQWLTAGFIREHTKDWEQVEVSGYDGAWYHTQDDPLTSEVDANYQSLLLLKGNELIEIFYDVNDPLYAADLKAVLPCLT